MKYNFSYPFYTLFVALFLIVGCKKEYESIEELDAVDVQNYIKQNNLTVQQYGNTGIYYQIITPGIGAVVNYTDQVFVTFSAKSLDGKFVMENNRYASFLGYFSRANGYPDSFGTTIKEILQKKGGTIRLIIPSHLAYGRTGNTTLNIPGNTSLDCTIQLYDVANQSEYEDIFVSKFLADNNITGMTKTNTGLYYQVITEGTGTTPITSESNITVAYTGKFANGTVFDQSTSLKSYLYELIPGWVEGLPKVKKGGKIRLIIPPSLGYGPSGSGRVPAYSILDFEIQVNEVE